MKNITGTIILSVATLLATTTSAKADCGIECWLSNTFSSRDWVGDWLRDNLGGIHNSGDKENGELVYVYKKASSIVSTWKPGDRLVNKENRDIKPVCSTEKLLSTINEKQKPEALLETCFPGALAKK